jgi:hypothetical protein
MGRSNARALAFLAVLVTARAAHADPLTINPMDPDLPPGGTQMFTASGGSGTGYVFSLGMPTPSGGTISMDGMYQAGSTGNVTDLVMVVDSDSNTAMTNVNVTMGVAIMPTAVTILPGSMQMFTASGGQPPYTWSIAMSGSGMPMISGGGLYVAGMMVGNDLVQVTDAKGKSATVTVKVVKMVPLGDLCTNSDVCPPDGQGQKHCVDGICCDSACSGTCQACNTAGKFGTCQTIKGLPVGMRSCPMSDPNNPCTAKACDGISPSTCDVFVGAETTCGKASCVSGIGTPGAVCMGNGKCQVVQPASCGAYACVSHACATSCNDTSQCAMGSFCDIATNKCVTPDGGASMTTHVDAGPTTDVTIPHNNGASVGSTCGAGPLPVDGEGLGVAVFGAFAGLGVSIRRRRRRR